jgi:hypothetical protein
VVRHWRQGYATADVRNGSFANRPGKMKVYCTQLGYYSDYKNCKYTVKQEFFLNNVFIGDVNG